MENINTNKQTILVQNIIYFILLFIYLKYSANQHPLGLKLKHYLENSNIEEIIIDYYIIYHRAPFHREHTSLTEVEGLCHNAQRSLTPARAQILTQLDKDPLRSCQFFSFISSRRLRVTTLLKGLAGVNKSTNIQCDVSTCRSTGMTAYGY